MTTTHPRAGAREWAGPGTLPAGPAAELLGVARGAFGDGFAAVGLLGAGLLAVAVVLALTTPRREHDVV